MERPKQCWVLSKFPILSRWRLPSWARRYCWAERAWSVPRLLLPRRCPQGSHCCQEQSSPRGSETLELRRTQKDTSQPERLPVKTKSEFKEKWCLIIFSKWSIKGWKHVLKGSLTNWTLWLQSDWSPAVLKAQQSTALKETPVLKYPSTLQRFVPEAGRFLSPGGRTTVQLMSSVFCRNCSIWNMSVRTLRIRGSSRNRIRYDDWAPELAKKHQIVFSY